MVLRNVAREKTSSAVTSSDSFDIALGSFLGWLRATEKMTDIKILDKSQAPGIFRWAHKFGSNATVKDVIPETEKLVEFAKMFALRAKAQ
ncbi:hypothetical protein RHGRI_033594 [Rhododendron griersonianum]|uniref:Uncharacterized protein n=1 Tax=Rhododendron griersonianum TaxID=479676 RepID=A0AAV6I0P8_9ERIC|nr:hypothetical protein RHGRI_033594 [Rhododendron griersonianum]